jgi:hypothetical protein
VPAPGPRWRNGVWPPLRPRSKAFRRRKLSIIIDGSAKSRQISFFGFGGERYRLVEQTIPHARREKSPKRSMESAFSAMMRE